MRDARLLEAGIADEIHRQDFFAKISDIEFSLQNGLIQGLEFGEGEVFWEQFKTDGLTANFGF